MRNRIVATFLGACITASLAWTAELRSVEVPQTRIERGTAKLRRPRHRATLLRARDSSPEYRGKHRP
jgi:hypothetical protein